MEVGIAEVGFVEVGVAEVGVAEVEAAEVGIAEVGVAEVGTVEGGPTEVGVAEVGKAEVGVAEVGPAEVYLSNRILRSPLIPGLCTLPQYCQLLLIRHRFLATPSPHNDIHIQVNQFLTPPPPLARG